MMRLRALSVKNFRLLHDVSLLLEERTTVIVGRNNSGKTSLTEVVKRVLDERPTFTLEDFSFASHQRFWDAFLAHGAGKPDAEVRSLIPCIEVRFCFEYDLNDPLGVLGEFVVDLDPGCTEAIVVSRYRLEEGKVADLFNELPVLKEGSSPEEQAAIRTKLFQQLKERLPKFFESTFSAEDPNDPLNTKPIEARLLRSACATGFISAQRGLDDASQKERVVIGKVLETLFNTAKDNDDDEESHDTTEQLEKAVQEIQDKLGADFNAKLDELLPALAIFGYPGLSDPKLRTETTLDVGRLLTNHTKIRYTGDNGVHLPEAYSGLGMRNIILILLRLREFYKLFFAMRPLPCTHLVFIEEPEVHLHPQMQEVFIRKLADIADKFSAEAGTPWPVQFVVSTHSSHVANEAHFEAVRYFMSSVAKSSKTIQTKIKDLRQGLSDKPEQDRKFLHQYMTLTRCDLFFADKAILIEGTTERLLLPCIIEQRDAPLPVGKKLSSCYLSVVEVGGAFAHRFIDLLDFLELKTLIITDIDAVKPNDKGKLVACSVRLGTSTSNACIKSWFADFNTDPASLHAVKDEQKVRGQCRIAFQIPETSGGPCGRSFEDAFMLANPKLFPNSGKNDDERERNAWEDAKDLKKSEFALKHAILVNEWSTPKYIVEGLTWLVSEDLPDVPMDVSAAMDKEAIFELAPVAAAAEAMKP